MQGTKTQAGTCHLSARINECANKSRVTQAPHSKPSKTKMHVDAACHVIGEAGPPNLYSNSPGPPHENVFPVNKTDLKAQPQTTDNSNASRSPPAQLTPSRNAIHV